MLTNALDDLPSTAEITPGTISIDRKAPGDTSWTSVVSDAACSESAGMVYYDEVFDGGTGYAEGDSIRITFKSQKITVSANDYDISDSTGRIFYTEIRNSSSGASAADIADAVWDEARAGHVAAGSFGEGVVVNSIANDAITAAAIADDAITAAKIADDAIDAGAIAAGAITAAAIATDAIDADALAADALAEINAQVDAAIETYGLDHLVAAAVAGADIVDNSIIAKLVSSSATADWDSFDNQTDSLQALRDALVTAAGIADQVWDELAASHQSAGSFGAAINSMADTIWNAVMEAGAPANAQTARQWMRLFAAVLFGATGDTGDWSAKSIDETKVRVAATLDSAGHRTQISTLDGS
jgi:hypothetical protein